MFDTRRGAFQCRTSPLAAFTVLPQLGSAVGAGRRGHVGRSRQAAWANGADVARGEADGAFLGLWSCWSGEAPFSQTGTTPDHVPSFCPRFWNLWLMD